MKDKLVVASATGFFLITFLVAFLLYQEKTKLEEIKDSDKSPKTEPITLLFVGDLGLGREINWQIKKRNDPNFPFLPIKEEIENADISVANLEGTLISDCPETRAGFKFCGLPKNGQGLNFIGFDLVNLANNHTSNYGPDGFLETINILQINNVDYFGEDKIFFKNIDDLSIAFLGYDDIVRRINIDNLTSAVKDSRKKVDIVVVSFHWGEEYQQEPNQRQITLAHSAIEAGADIIIGHHPHVIQPLNYYQQKPIFFSLGNFLFDQLWSSETRTGLIAKITIENKKITKTETTTTWINDQYQTEIYQE